MKRTFIPGLNLVSSAEGRHRAFHANDLDVFNAEIWAREALEVLTGNLVLGNLPYRDYSDQVGKWGDVVNIARPGSFEAKRKGALCEDIQIQDASADSFQIALDQFLYTSFKICDGEENRPLVDLIDTFLTPAALSLTSKIDLILGAQHTKFWDNYAGHLGGVNSTNISDYLLDTIEVLDQNAVPTTNRQMIITPKTRTAALKEKLFVAADQSGSARTLRTGELGNLYGLDLYAANTQPYIRPGQSSVTAAVNNASGYSAGATAITVDAAGAFTAGQYVTIAGDDTPLRIASASIASNAGTITLMAPGLRRDVVDNAAVRAITAGAVNGAFYGTTTEPRKIGYAKMITTDGWVTGTSPKVGQPVSFGVNTEIYTVIEVSSFVMDSSTALPSNSYNIMLDRPLLSAVADNATVNLGPAGNYNFAFAKNALAAAFRPLPKPRTGTLSSVITYKGIPIRVTISYHAIQQAHIITLDLLMGVASLDTTQGAVMFA